ncbi:MAG: tyrosine-type recombinase/integrase [Calditrichia bacterium]
MVVTDLIVDPDIVLFMSVKSSLAPNSLKSYGLLLYHFETFCISKDIRPTFAKGPEVSEFMNQYSDHRISTRKGYLKILKVFYAWLMDERTIDKDPTKHIVIEGRARASDKRTVTPEEYKKMRLRCQGLREMTILSMLYYTGVRASELCELTLDSVNLSEDYLFVSFSKTEKGNRRIPIHNDFKKILDTYIQARINKNYTHEYLFVNKQGRKMEYRTLLNVVKNLVADSYVNSKTACHAFRRGFITQVYRAKRDIVLCQILAGHASIETTRGYIANLEEHVKEFQEVTF